MTTFNESHKPYGPTISVTLLYMLCKLTNTGTCTALKAQTHRSTRTQLRVLSRTLTSDISLGSLTLPAPQARDFLELILQYINEKVTWINL
jgi:hypothetical protein